MATHYAIVSEDSYTALSSADKAKVQKLRGFLMDPESTADNAIEDRFSSMTGTTFGAATNLLRKDFNVEEETFAEQWTITAVSCTSPTVTWNEENVITGSGDVAWLTDNNTTLGVSPASHLVYTPAIAITPGIWSMSFKVRSEGNIGTGMKVYLGTSTAAATTTKINGFVEQTVANPSVMAHTDNIVDVKYRFETTHNANAYLKFRYTFAGGVQNLTIQIDDILITNERGAKINMKTETAGGGTSPYISGQARDQYVPHSVNLSETNVLTRSPDNFFVVLHFNSDVLAETNVIDGMTDITYTSKTALLTAMKDGNTYGKSFYGATRTYNDDNHMTADNHDTMLNPPTPGDPCGDGYAWDSNSERCEAE